MDAFEAASAKHQPKSYIPSTVKTQNILILLLFSGADWSVRAVLKISANLTFEGVYTSQSIYSTWDAYITLTSTRSAHKLFRIHIFYEKTFFLCNKPRFYEKYVYMFGKICISRMQRIHFFLVKFKYSEKATKT